MKIEDVKIGMKVRIHPGGKVFIVKHVFGRYASLVSFEQGNEEDYGNCPVAMLDEVVE